MNVINAFLILNLCELGSCVRPISNSLFLCTIGLQVVLKSIIKAMAPLLQIGLLVLFAIVIFGKRQMRFTKELS